MSLSTSEGSPGAVGLPQAEINWERLDKTKFFVVGTGLFTGVTTLLFPFSVIKTRLQVATISPTEKVTAIGTAKNIARYEGLPGFYRGFGTIIAGTVPARCAYLSTLEVTKAYVLTTTSSMGLPEATKAGLAAGAGGFCGSLASQLIVVPMDVISSRLMAQGGHGGAPAKYAGGLDAFQTILRTQGIRGLYRGFGMSIITYAPSSATWWSTYGASQRVFWRALGYGGEGEGANQKAPGGGTVVLVQAVGGTCAGGVAALVTTPLDTVKTRIQVLESEAGNRPTVRSTVNKLLREEGVKGFYRGLGPRWASMSLWGTCMITTYEFLKRLSVKP